MLEGFYKSGRCRAIGVSNYEQHHLQELLDCAAVKPMVNQVSLLGRPKPVCCLSTCATPMAPCLWPTC